MYYKRKNNLNYPVFYGSMNNHYGCLHFCRRGTNGDATDFNDTDLKAGVGNYTTTLKTSYPVAAAEGQKSALYNMLLLTQENIYLYVYAKDASCKYTQTNNMRTVQTSDNPVTVVTGTFEKISASLTNFNNYFDTTLPASEAYKQALEKWTNLFDEAYKTVKQSAALTSAGVYLLLDLGIVVIMSLTVFFLSRTKSSIRKFGYFESLKMILFASLSHALLSLILGFLIPSMQTMGFVLFFGLRITWLGMKATSPQENTEAVRK